MNLRTEIQKTNAGFDISHKDYLMSFGSCFSEFTGRELINSGFKISSNPFGILFNPYSICKNINRIIDGVFFSSEELVYYNTRYFSFSHHGSFSGTNKQETLDAINSSFSSASDIYKKAGFLIITFGTAWVYHLKETNEVVSNCHKMPASLFERKRLSVKEIVDEYSSLFDKIFSSNPEVKIILSVSPVRHIRDGIHENNISKAILHLAVGELTDKYENVIYFPSYEILMDDLRDYRFYDEDMVHPSGVAKKYVWEYFSNTFFDEKTKKIASRIRKIHKAMDHKPLYGYTDEYEMFLTNNIASIKLLTSNYPYLDLSKEWDFFSNILNKK